jgi:endonuclease-3
MEKAPFDIDIAIRRIEEAVRPYPKAAMFDLAERGYSTPFEQLIACLLSIRTRDETSLRASIRLFDLARTPDALINTPPGEIEQRIADVTFAGRKAYQIGDLARIVRDDFGGELPCDDAVIQSLPGIGPKCAHLVLGVACGQAEISVDIHVHRVTNRWGYIHATTPEKSMLALQAILPERYHIEINRLLVPFGKHVCTGTRPRCSTCPVLDMCQQVGVTNPR